MKVICKNCGAEIDDFDAVEFNTGRVQYMCIECYKAGRHQVNMHSLKWSAKKDRQKNVKNRR